MDWWAKLKTRLFGQPQESGEAREARLPARITATCICSGDSHDLEIRSFSPTGLMLRSQQGLEPREIVLLRVPLHPQSQAVEFVDLKARVVWVREREEGEFDLTVTYVGEEGDRDGLISQLLDAYGVSLWDDRRSSRRHRADLPAVLRGGDGSEIRGTVRNVSTGGVQVKADHGRRLRKGDGVIVEMLPPHKGRVLKLAGSVVTARDEAQSGGAVYGVAFSNLKDGESDALLQIVIDTLQDRASRRKG